MWGGHLPRYQRLSTRVQGGTVQFYLHEDGLNIPVPATRLSDGTIRDSRYSAKQVRWVDPGVAHQDENLSKAPLRFIRIELKLSK